MNTELEKALRNTLEGLITPNKKNHIDRVIENRTRHLTVVLEDIHKPHNASAVLRTIECFGLQDYHIIESKKQYRISPHVAKGAGKWVDIHRYNHLKGEDTQTCINQLRDKGYVICVTSPKPGGFTPEDVPLQKKLAVFFGNELRGLSETALKEADMHLHIPMWGFTESLNVSVSASLIFHTLLSRLQKSSINWRMSEEERNRLRMEWYRKIITRSETIERELLKQLKIL